MKRKEKIKINDCQIANKAFILCHSLRGKFGQDLSHLYEFLRQEGGKKREKKIKQAGLVLPTIFFFYLLKIFGNSEGSN